MSKYEIRALMGLLICLIGGGTLFFHVTEKWSWLDSYYFTVTTISTVGYGDLSPSTALGKIGTTFLIFSGIGTLALALQILSKKILSKRGQKLESKKKFSDKPQD